MFKHGVKRIMEGGVYLPARKDSTRDLAIEPLAIPPRLRVPLDANGVAGAHQPVVKDGQAVHRGELLARAVDPNAVDVHAPADGVVKGVTCIDTPHRLEVPAVELDVVANPHDVYDALDDADAPFVDLITQAGVLNAKGQALGPLLAKARDAKVRTLIVNGMESEPMLTAQRRILVEHPREVMATFHLLLRATGARRGIVVVGLGDRAIGRSLRHASRDGRVSVVRLPEKYPQGDGRMLIKMLLGREVPLGREPLDTGVFVLDASDLWAAHHAVHLHAPMTSRVITVSGDDVLHPGNYVVPIGTSIRQIAEAVGLSQGNHRIVAGGPLTGNAVDNWETVVSKRTEAVLFIRGKDDRAARAIACVHCGFCQDACPAGVDPAALYSRAEEGDAKRMTLGRPEACLECGLCEYVCPSLLPLVEGVRRCREAVDGPRKDSRPSDSQPSDYVKPDLLDLPSARRSPPHIHGRQKWATMHWTMLLAAVPLVVAGSVLFGSSALGVLCVSVVASVISRWLYSLLTGQPGRWLGGQVLLIGVLVGLVLPPDARWEEAALAACVATLAGYGLMGGLGNYLWHPVLVGWVAVLMLMGGTLQQTHWPFLGEGYLWSGQLSAAYEPLNYFGFHAEKLPYGFNAWSVPRTVDWLITAYGAGGVELPADHVLAGLVRDCLPPWSDTLWGYTGGTIGGTCTLAILLAGSFLWYRGLIKWQLPVGAVLAAGAVAAVLPIGSDNSWFPIFESYDGQPLGLYYVLFHLTAGELLFGCIIIGTDLTTTPTNRRGHLLFGIGVGVLTMLLRFVGVAPGSCLWAILIMNTLVPLIDRLSRRRVYGM